MKKIYVLINLQNSMSFDIPDNFRTFESPEEFLKMMDVLKKFPNHIFERYPIDPDCAGSVNAVDPLPSYYTLYEVNLSDDEEYVIDHDINDYGAFEILKIRKKEEIKSTIKEVLTTEEDND